MLLQNVRCYYRILDVMIVIKLMIIIEVILIIIKILMIMMIIITTIIIKNIPIHKIDNFKLHTTTYFSLQIK